MDFGGGEKESENEGRENGTQPSLGRGIEAPGNAV